MSLLCIFAERVVYRGCAHDHSPKFQNNHSLETLRKLLRQIQISDLFWKTYSMMGPVFTALDLAWAFTSIILANG